ncbi:choline monooxygenase [Gaeumannomyces tritici R3-111a-1]|uniref:Choline monooxygenase, chloroplastic n=1 Tax=Gaeumannomyces tritici (strain R3-111a-1) TaxID=644352 RepID=J3P1N4_GAET3|nr:choline monooxygenase [Gaeumannomyces tritici R3-111a-1]EJT73576.1 choline monooxygenase [Gaeumannomyces tritici R3-111a-1]
MSLFKSFFGKSVDGGPPSPTEKSAVRALPAEWYTSQDMYSLERRAIFSRKWLLTTHKARIPNPGDWVRYDVAGYQFIIVRDRKDGTIHAMHNVCRHRAFPVVTKDEGNSYVFSCKYHGWSYGLKGNLAKAPGYQDLPGFDRAKNSLFPIHVHLDRNGFVWVNMDAGETPEIAWSDDFAGIDEQERFQHYNFEDYVFDHQWDMEGDWNWKILADNYNECYHCPTSHPDIPSIADLNSYFVNTEKAFVQHFGEPTPEQIAQGFRVAATYYWPNASMNVSPHFFMIQRFVPFAPNKSQMRYEVYRNKNSSDEDFKTISEMYKRIMSEDKYLCANAQRNIDAGVFVNGELHPDLEKGPLYFQKVVREVVTEHFENERKGGAEIWPARQKVPEKGTGEATKEDRDFCAAVETCGKQKASCMDEGTRVCLDEAIAF